MPGLNRIVTDAQPIGFDEFIARLDEGGAALDCAEAVEARADLLARLSANRDFLVDIALTALKDECAQQAAANGYGGQVMLLHRDEGRFFVRANFWPGLDDPVAR